MGLSNKMKQRITITGGPQNAMEALASRIAARKLKDTRVSSVSYAEDQWQCIVTCKYAEVIYYQEVLLLLYDSVETQSFHVLLELEDNNKLVKKCPTELLVSFELSSQYAFGDKAENEFIQNLYRDIMQSPQSAQAAVTYYIIGGGAVTMCVPCAKPEEMKEKIEKRLKSTGIKKHMINLADRERG